MSFAIETWGCQMNRHDSRILDARLRAAGLVPAADTSSADLVLLNTCSVREKPVQKILSRIGELAKLLPRPVIGVCGCVAQQHGEALLERSPAVGFVLGPGQIGRVGEAIEALSRGERSVLTSLTAVPAGDEIESARDRRASVTVIHGCNERCTYCVVPMTRGPEVSRPAAAVLDEVRGVVGRGAREIELLGQTINAYVCPESGARFAGLLEMVVAVPGVERVLFVTSHPRHFDRRLIEVMANHRTVSRYLHLPLQSGSDRVLRRMARHYTRARYLRLVAEIRQAIPDVNLSTDVITGFPGETAADFEQTLSLLEEVRFGQVFGFAYSPRPGTPAERLGDPVAATVKSERLQRLFEVTERISLELNQQLVGREVRVLVDGVSRRSGSDWQGRGEDNRVVNFAKTGSEQIGDFVTVRITRAGPHSLIGERSRSSVPLPILPVMP